MKGILLSLNRDGSRVFQESEGTGACPGKVRKWTMPLRLKL